MALLDFMNALFALPPAVSILAISVAVSVATTVIYKYTTNQKLLKEMKENVSRMQAEIRTTKEPGRAAQLQKEMMGHSMRQLNASTKSMLITIIPLFLIFGWMRANLAYDSLAPGEEFTTTAYFAKAVEQNGSALALGNITLSASRGMEVLSDPSQEVKGRSVSWRLKSPDEGTYKLTYGIGNETYSLNALVTQKFRYENPLLTKPKGIMKTSMVERITVDLKPVQPFGSFSLFGWKPGWLATYIIFSLAASMLARKWLKVF